MPKTFRNVTIRISALNHATKDNEVLGIKAGDEVRYTLKDILNVLEDWSNTKDIKYYAIEHNEDPDNIHFHVVISFRIKWGYGFWGWGEWRFQSQSPFLRFFISPRAAPAQRVRPAMVYRPVPVPPVWGSS